MPFNFKEMENLLVCPGSRSKLIQEADSLICLDRACRLKFAIRDDIPIMLVDEAIKLSPEEWGHIMERHSRDRTTGEQMRKPTDGTDIPIRAVARSPVRGSDRRAGRVSARRQPAEGRGSPPKGRQKARTQRYQFAGSTTDGIGKFYLGREIAHVMGYQGIDWLERPERESEEHLTQLVDSLKLSPGMVVADIGAGSGVISLMMAKKVGPTGTVWPSTFRKKCSTSSRSGSNSSR